MPRALSLMGELLKDYETQIEAITLQPSDGGRFEVTVNDRLIYSKMRTGRHAEPGEVLGLLRKFIQEKS
jgi:selenoprotein W-related protein